MKLLILMALMLPLMAQAKPCSVVINAATVNIPTTYATVAASRKDFRTCLSQVSGGGGVSALAGRVAIKCTGSMTAPADESEGTPSSYSIPIEADGYVILDDAGMGPVCYIRSLTGSAITTGIVTLTLKGY